MSNFGPTALQKFVLQINLHIIFIIPFYSLVRGRGRPGSATTFDISSDEDVGDMYQDRYGDLRDWPSLDIFGTSKDEDVIGDRPKLQNNFCFWKKKLRREWNNDDFKIKYLNAKYSERFITCFLYLLH